MTGRAGIRSGLGPSTAAPLFGSPGPPDRDRGPIPALTTVRGLDPFDSLTRVKCQP
jgi:hypothetical protein